MGTNLIFPASKFEVPILNTEWSFLQAQDFNEMSKNRYKTTYTLCHTIMTAEIFYIHQKYRLLCYLRFFLNGGNDHSVFNMGTSNLEAGNIRLVNRITSMLEQSTLISENMSPNVLHY
jgi:hypothetical protein